MNYNPADRRAAESRALIATLAIAGQARWSLDRVGPVLELPFARYLYVESAQVLLVPTAAKLIDEIEIVSRAMREARSDALIVRAIEGDIGRVEISLGFWALRENCWHAPMTLWRSPAQASWIVPDPYLAGIRHECFLLEKARLRPKSAPWNNSHEQRAGLIRAQSWVGRVLAPR